MSVYLGTQLLSGVSTNTISNAHDLFDFKWVDHQLTDQSWLNADTFSWQDGTVYSDAYNHLNADYNGGTSTTETIGSYTITYVLADDGHKITTDETTVANIYNETGVAWYYVIDQANTRFKLPRTKYGFEGLRDSVGNLIEESLPNISGSFGNSTTAEKGPINGSTYTGAFYGTNSKSAKVFASGNSSTTHHHTIDFSASNSNSIYKAGAHVQERATQMYLYFYVGQFSQSATEQTAGLNAGLFNGKVDLDSSFGFPSGTYDDLTLGASDTSYTAPANGYILLSKFTTGSQNIQLWVNGDRTTCEYMTCVNVYTNGTLCTAWLPVKKGAVVTVHYNTGGTTDMFRFIYAEDTN